MSTAMEVLGVFNELTEKIGEISTTASSQLLFKSLKLAFTLLQSMPNAADGRPLLSRASSVAYLLADLQMDAEVVSAGILRETLLTGAITIDEVESQIGAGIAHLLLENLRIKDMHSKDETLDDDERASALRKQILTFYDIKAVILELAVRLDLMRHLEHIPKYNQQKASLQALKIYAPLAHAVGAAALSLELEDHSFRHLFPSSYLYLDTWLSSHEPESKPLLEVHKDQLLQELKSDGELEEIVSDILVKGRYKSRFSTMKKLLRDGHKPEELHDILGLRVILDPKPGDMSTERGNRACYRTLELIQSLWKVVPTRTKDYIAKPKGNGYRSLHVVLDLSELGTLVIPLMEIQIRTTEMDMMAEGGVASHSLYKGGLTNPEEAKRLKDIMLAAAEITALHLKDLPSANNRGEAEIDTKNPVFRFLDENGDGRISIEELTTVMKDLGAESKDALELMQLLDTDNDGFLSSDEFDSLQKQVGFMRNMEDADDHYKTILGEKFEKTDGIGLIQVYRKELSGKLAVS